MQQNPQIVPIHPKIPAYFIFVTIFQKNFPQQPAVALRKPFQNLTNFFSRLFGRKGREHIHRAVNRLGFLIFVAAKIVSGRAIMLLQYMRTNGIHKRSQALGMKNLPVPQGG